MLLKNFNKLHPEIRQRFPQLEQDGFGTKRVHLNCGAGTLMVDTAAVAMAVACRTLNSLPGEVAPAEIAARDLHDRVRRAVADFLNAPAAEEVSFHASSTAALFNLAFALGSILEERSNLIVTDLDHMANISPWEMLWGKQAGCEVRRCGIDDQGLIDPERLLALCDERTGLVAMTMASNALGTIVPLKTIVRAVRKRSPRALVCVDAVHHALHGPIDVQDIDCDFLVFSGYKVFGPVLGVLWGKRALLDALRPYRVETNKDVMPYKFEQGTLNNAALAALLAALEYLTWIGERLKVETDEAKMTARLALHSAMSAISLYDRNLTEAILKGFQKLDGGKFRCFGIVDPARSLERDPTFSFEISGWTAEDLKKELWVRHALQVAGGNHYSAAVVRHLKRPSICRASFCHYHTLQDVGRFIEALRGMA